jgi:putative protease
MNYKAAEVYFDMGVKRIVLARELSIDKIAELRAKTPKDLELECFVHGAMCMAYSGRCLISAFLAGRSGNRGECAQSCRWTYHLMEEKRPGEYFPVFEDDRGMTILSSKELCCIDILDRLAEAGVCSFKIEGRMRTPYSIGTVVNAYRMAMDGTADPDTLHKELDTTSHRTYCTGFYLGDPSQVASDDKGYIREWLFVATAGEKTEDGRLVLNTRNAFNAGDELEVLSSGKPGRAFTVSGIRDEEGVPMDRSASPMRTVTIDDPGLPDIEPGDLIRKKQ